MGRFDLTPHPNPIQKKKKKEKQGCVPLGWPFHYHNSLVCICIDVICSVIILQSPLLIPHPLSLRVFPHIKIYIQTNKIIYSEMGKKRKSVGTSLDEVDRSMYSTFCNGANAISQLYSQAVNHQKLSFQSGERHALVYLPS